MISCRYVLLKSYQKTTYFYYKLHVNWQSAKFAMAHFSLIQTFQFFIRR